LGVNQGKSLLLVMAALRERVWQLCGISYSTIHVNIDTTVETLFGEQEGGRKGHNTKHRGKRGFRPVLAFIEETREYLVGKLRQARPWLDGSLWQCRHMEGLRPQPAVNSS